MTRRKAGRPPFVPTPTLKERVRVLVAGGLSHHQIAAVLDITAPTLRKHFKHELEVGLATTLAAVWEARYKRAMDGNVSAQNRIIQHLERSAAEQNIKGPEKPVKPVKLGKKEAALKAAQEVSDIYQPRGSLRLVAGGDE